MFDLQKREEGECVNINAFEEWMEKLATRFKHAFRRVNQ